LESSLYLPVKRFLESWGFEVKGEVCGCDLLALDISFCVDRLAACVARRACLAPRSRPRT
jgi:hypothetical protein